MRPTTTERILKGRHISKREILNNHHLYLCSEGREGKNWKCLLRLVLRETRHLKWTFRPTSCKVNYRQTFPLTDCRLFGATVYQSITGSSSSSSPLLSLLFPVTQARCHQYLGADMSADANKWWASPLTAGPSVSVRVIQFYKYNQRGLLWRDL